MSWLSRWGIKNMQKCALLEVKDGEREYTINTLMTRLQRKKLEEALREVREILRFDFSMV